MAVVAPLLVCFMCNHRGEISQIFVAVRRGVSKSEGHLLDNAPCIGQGPQLAHAIYEMRALVFPAVSIEVCTVRSPVRAVRSNQNIFPSSAVTRSGVDVLRLTTGLLAETLRKLPVKRQPAS